MTESFNPESECHGCTAIVSLFEFEKKSGGWRLIQTDSPAFAWGSWGRFGSKDQLRAKVIGYNIYGIFLEAGFSMGGGAEEATSVKAKVADDYRTVLHIRTHEYYSSGGPMKKTTDWSAEIEILQGVTGFFDLMVTIKGIENQKPINEKIEFEFNGVEYIPTSDPGALNLY